MSSSEAPNAEGVEAESNKRAALAGQWRTPPLPIFPTNNAQPEAASAPPTTTSSTENLQGLPPVSQLPDSHEDYAKALQEAYRRGAEAAAAMAHQPPSSMMPSAVSCPDLQQQQQQSIMPAPVEQQQPPTLEQQQQEQQVPILPPPPPQQQQADINNKPMASPPTPSAAVMPPPPPVSSSSSQQQQRSMSLPDMTTYAAQQEEEKRKKRLARNRASARLRRLRKKNLVDAYETEVGILEKTLKQLKTHEWGAQDNANALTDALSMDRGQQVLDVAQRKSAAAGVLQQQLQFVEMLEELMAEQYVLQQLKDSNEFDDLKESLQLSDEQLQQLSDASSGWEEEWAALQTVKASLTAMKENDWLWNEGVTQVAEQFMSILHKNQVSKMLLWTDHNSEAIDELDVVNAASSVPNGPVFSFGVDSNPEGLVDEEK